MTPTFRVYLTYAAWRRSVPFTDTQIVAALRDLGNTVPSDFLKNRYYGLAAYLERTGRLSSIMLSLVVDRLITACACCGKKALYRAGNEGRCREHKYVPNTGVEQYWHGRRTLANEKSASYHEDNRMMVGVEQHRASVRRRR